LQHRFIASCECAFANTLPALPAVGDEVSFNKVKDGLLNKYPSLDVAARKAEFKDWAREIIESQ
jgi:hypothetical protein